MWWLIGDVMALWRCDGSMEMWWLIGCAPDFWGRGPGFISGFSHNDPDALQDHCDKVENLRVERETYP